MTGLGRVPVVRVVKVVPAVGALHSRGDGREEVGESVKAFKDRSGREEGVVDGVEVPVLGLDVADEDTGVEVDLER